MEPTPAAETTRRRWLRPLLIMLPGVLFVSLLTYALITKGDTPAPGDPAPGFEAPLLTGSGTLSLDELDGKPVFLNFWWSGCEPCKDEAPALKRAHEIYGDEIAFVGINIRDARADALEFADRYDLDYPHVEDDTLTIYRDYGLTGQPESFFIDRDGEVVEHVAGPVDETSLTRLLDVLVTRGG